MGGSIGSMDLTLSRIVAVSHMAWKAAQAARLLARKGNFEVEYVKYVFGVVCQS